MCFLNDYHLISQLRDQIRMYPSLRHIHSKKENNFAKIPEWYTINQIMINKTIVITQFYSLTAQMTEIKNEGKITNK